MGAIVKGGLPWAPEYSVWGSVDAGTATSGDSKSLIHAGKSWTIDEHIGRLVEIHTGTGIGQIRKIKSNTADTLVINSDVDAYWDFKTTPDNTSEYVILFNYEDVYQADLAGGWGIITKQGSNQYYITTALYIGISGYDPAWFGDSTVSIKWVDHQTKTTIGYSSRYRYGEIIDPANKITANGVYDHLEGIICSSAHSVYLCSSKLVNSSALVQGLPAGSRVWNCTITGVYFNNGGLTNFYNINVLPSKAMLVYNMPISADKIFMIGIQKAFVPYDYGDLVVSNTELVEEEYTLYDTYNRMHGDVYLDNVVAKYHMFINPTGVQGKAWRRNPIELSLADNLGGVIDGGVCAIYNSDGKPISLEASGSLLTADIDSTQVDIDVTDGANFTANDVIRIDCEYMQVTNIVTNTLTVTRNYYGANYFNILHYEDRIIYIVTPVSSTAGVVPKMLLIDGYFDKLNGDTCISYGPLTKKLYKYGKQILVDRFEIDFAIKQSSTMFDNDYITEAIEATVAAYSGITVNHTAGTVTISVNHTLAEIYDYLQYDIALHPSFAIDETMTTGDGNNFICEYDFIIDTGINIIADDKKLTMVTGKTYTLTGTANFTGIIADQTKTRVPLTVSGLVAGSRVQVYNVDTSTELYNEIEATTEFLKYFEHTVDVNIRVRVMYVDGVSAYEWWTALGVILNSGFALNVAQEVNTPYEDNNIDGSTVTECAINGNKIDINVNDPDNTLAVQRIYNWYQYYLSTEAGIRDSDDKITATDQTHYTFDNDVQIINLDTVNPLNLTGANIVPVSGLATSVFDLTNGASIALNFERVEGFPYVSGASEFTSDEIKQIRDALGVDGTKTAAVGGQLQDVLADTNDLQTNQGDFATAVGFSTHTPADVKTAMEAAGSSLATVKDQVGYALGCIWIDINNGSPGSVVGVNGVFTNPVVKWADALLLSAATGIKFFHWANGSYTLIHANCTNYSFYGNNYTLYLHPASYHTNFYIKNAILVGSLLNTLGSAELKNCTILELTLDSAILTNCFLRNIVHLIAVDASWTFNSCYSSEEITSQAQIDFDNTTGANTCFFNNWSGYLKIRYLNTPHSLIINGKGKLIIDSTCSGGTITIAGDFEIIDEVVGGFQGTLNQEALFNKTETREAVGLASANLDIQLATIQTDLDTPDQYKATGFAPPNEYDGILKKIKNLLGLIFCTK